MIPDLGKYALWVLSAYGVSIALLIGIVVLSVMQSRRTLAALRRMEEGRAAGPHARAGTGRGTTEGAYRG